MARNRTTPLRVALAATTGVVLAGMGHVHAQDEGPLPDQTFQEEKAPGTQLDVSLELKTHFRWSQPDQFQPGFPFPEDFIPVGRDAVFLETVSPGSSLEVSVATLFLDAELPRSIRARVKIDFIDLYDRNPTSGDQTVDVDEAWIQLGNRYGSLEGIPGSSAYAFIGKAPKFERQALRRLESYGLVSTSFNRFEDLQLQVGGSLGSHFYVRGQVSNGNPTFFRDPNVLAGDNGTQLPPDPDPTLGSGFPILYHAESEELGMDDELEYGIGAGLSFVSYDERTGVDLLGFYYRTTLAEAAKLRGTFYEGDLDLLDGVADIGLPIEGDGREEYGANLDLRVKGFSAFAQWVHENVAALRRDGLEVEAAYAFTTGDSADPKALFTRIEPAVRYSRLDNDFSAPPQFVAPSLAWDWQKWDFGIRTTVREGVDLTLEYTTHDIQASRSIDHDEFLATLRLRF
jgi:hypothetical protein